MDIHSLQGRAHAQLATTSTALVRRLGAEERGQGSVEYVALIMLVGGVLAAAVTALGHTDGGIGRAITGKIKDAIEGATGARG